MKGATRYANALRELFDKRADAAKKQQEDTPDEKPDPVQLVLLAILARGTTYDKARQALKRIMESIVDFNELRVAPPAEVLELLDNSIPGAEIKCTQIAKVLNQIFDKHHTLNLEYLHDKPRADIESALERIDLLDSYGQAFILLMAFNMHAVPVDEKMLAWWQHEGLIAKDATCADARTMLERHIKSAEARDFYLCMSAEAAAYTPSSSSGDGKKASAKSTTAKKKTAGKATSKKASKSVAKKKSTTANKKKTTSKTTTSKTTKKK